MGFYDSDRGVNDTHYCAHRTDYWYCHGCFIKSSANAGMKCQTDRRWDNDIYCFCWNRASCAGYSVCTGITKPALFTGIFFLGCRCIGKR